MDKEAGKEHTVYKRLRVKLIVKHDSKPYLNGDDRIQTHEVDDVIIQVHGIPNVWWPSSLITTMVDKTTDSYKRAQSKRQWDSDKKKEVNVFDEF